MASASSVAHRVQAAPALPAPMCALSSAQIICYDAQTAVASPVSAPGQQVVDFSVSPEGNWVAYRTPEALFIAQTRGNQNLSADPDAAAPAAIAPEFASLVWSPDGLGIAYTTAKGLRVAYPGGHFYDLVDRPYINLKWSPSGTRLAAQSADGDWTFFETDPSHVRPTRVFSQTADVAWIADDAVIVAPIAGGLLRIDPASADAPPVWYIQGEYFIRLQSGAPGEVLALHPDPGTVIGNTVSISADGHWIPLGRAKLDSRLDWGPAPGEVLYYITSGTPILVERVTGNEDMLPMRNVSSIEWGPPPLPEVQGVSMDADLYFLAPDTTGVAQLWRLTRYGFPVVPISQSVIPVTAYQVFPDHIQYTVGGVEVYVNPDGTLPEIATSEAAPAPTKTPVPPTVASVASELRSVGWQPGPTAVQRVYTNGAASKPYLLENALVSPGGKVAAGNRGSARGPLVILDWATGRAVRIQGINGAKALRWVQ